MSWSDAPVIARALLEDDAPVVAPRLLGLVLVRDGRAGRIVEVEAYTADDPASHSARGRTARSASMFDRAGTLYVYFTYGMHYCANVVTGAVGDGQAVLLRALEPIGGLAAMRRARPDRRDRELCDGPAKLCQSFGLDRSFDGADLCDPNSEIRLVDDGFERPQQIATGTRIGIREGRERPWRWWIPREH